MGQRVRALVQPRSPPHRPALCESGAAPCGLGPGDLGGAGGAVRPSRSGEPETVVRQDTRLVADRGGHAQSRAGMTGRGGLCCGRRNKRSRGMTRAATTLTCFAVAAATKTLAQACVLQPMDVLVQPHRFALLAPRCRPCSLLCGISSATSSPRSRPQSTGGYCWLCGTELFNNTPAHVLSVLPLL